MIDDENVASQSGSAKVVKGEIVAVVAIDVYKGCRNCNAKMIDQLECTASATQR